jgi:UDP-glucose 4-epimerase
VTVLVTGAAGFVGRHVVDALLDAGLGPIVAADATPADADARLDVRSLALDVTDGRAVRAAVADVRPSFVVHAAALTPTVAEEADAAARIVAVNVGGAANVAEAALEQGGVERFLMFSSSGVYNGLPVYPKRIFEDAALPQRPASLYAVTKLACEGLAHRLTASERLSACAIRVASVYGEHEHPTASRTAARMSLAHRLALATAAGTPVRTQGLEARREWVHGADVGRAVIALLTAPALRHVIYNVGSGEAATFRMLLDLFVAEGLRIVDDQALAPIGMTAADDRPPLDLARLTDAGWRPQVALAAGVRDLVAHHRRMEARP